MECNASYKCLTLRLYSSKLFHWIVVALCVSGVVRFGGIVGNRYK